MTHQLSRRAMLAALPAAGAAPALAFAPAAVEAADPAVLSRILIKAQKLGLRLNPNYVNDPSEASRRSEDLFLPDDKAPSPETPIMRLFREWVAVREAIEGVSEEEADRLVNVMSALENRMLDMRALDHRDHVAKFAAHTSWGHFNPPDFDLPFWDEARRLLGRPELDRARS